MASHVGDCKMRLSKFLFIAMVALCLVFMRVSAQPGDEVAVENEGEAAAPGGQAVEGAAEVGESQAAQDLVRSQMATTRGPSRSQAPSKAQKSNKLKIAIIIAVIVVALAAGCLSGYFLWWRPKQKRGREEAVANQIKAGFGDEVEMKYMKMGDDKKEAWYAVAKEKKDPTDPQVKIVEDFHQKLAKVDGVKQVGTTLVFSYKSDDDLKKFGKALGATIADDAKTEDIRKAIGKAGQVGVLATKYYLKSEEGKLTWAGVAESKK